MGNTLRPMGFDPYRRLRRARMTRAGDIAFLVGFLLVLTALIAWAVL